MSRWIDAEWLENNAKEYSLGYYEEDEWATPLNALDSAPTIEIVRCRECKWRKAKMMPKSVKCLFSGKDDDFCSYGEREGE